MEDEGKRCPCEFEEIEPCGRQCSCRNPHMSGACRRCCTVGSPEQQLARARWLVANESLLKQQTEILSRIVRTGDVSETGPCGPEKWPPLDPGTKVKTTSSKADLKGWLPECLASRKWGVTGIILKHHDSHGLSYEVQHEDGTVGHYDPLELEVRKVQYTRLETLRCLIEDNERPIHAFHLRRELRNFIDFILQARQYTAEEKRTMLQEFRNVCTEKDQKS